MRKLAFVILLLLALLTKSWAVAYTSFVNVTMPRDADVSMVACIEQDSNGLIWLGTNCGLFSYDGFTMRYHSQRVCGSHIYCVKDIKGDALYVGTDYGLWAYDYQAGDFRDWLEGSPNGVRAIVEDGDALWLGTASGLYNYDLKTKRFAKCEGGQLGNEVVYSLQKTADGNIYIGTYNGLFYYDRQRKHFRQIDLPLLPGKSNVFVNALLEDQTRKCLWIGTGGRLYRYGTATNQMESVPELEHNSIKSFALDNSGQLMIGTDNGLYIYQDKEHVTHVRHDSRHSDNSLINDVVWSLKKDMDGHVWIGTDEGVSISRESHEIAFMPISTITGTGMGNHFYHILQDHQRNLWLGGSDGLIRTNPNFTQTIWFRVDNPPAAIAHNRIRKIYEDNDGDLWICTDGGIHFWNKNHWQHINLKDRKSDRNANWAYDIHEDQKGRIWVASFMGGLMVADKEKLLSSKGECLADTCLILPDGKGLKPFQMAEDKHHNLWVLYYDDGMRKISTQTLQTEPVENVDKILAGEVPSYIYEDKQHRLWIGLSGKVLCLNDTLCPYKLGASGSVEWITGVDNAIWVGTKSDVWEISDSSVRRIETPDKIIEGACYDGTGLIYLGSVDGIYYGSPAQLKYPMTNHPIRLTSVYANNLIKNSFLESDKPILFSPDERHIDFMISDLPYTQPEKSQYLYRLKDIDKDWSVLPKGANRITFNNLAYGSYLLEIGRLGVSGEPKDIIQIPFILQHPWYLRWWAYTLYILGGLAFIGWCFMYYRIRSRLKYEQQEKEHILEQLRLRMEVQPDLRQAAAVSDTQPIVAETTEQISPADEKFLKEVTTAIESRVSDSDLNVQSLCEQVGLGNKLVYRKLKQLTGKTPVGYIRSIRLSKAASLLRQKKFTISEVMYLSGFSNASYFSKCFQTEYGCSPREYAEKA